MKTVIRIDDINECMNWDKFDRVRLILEEADIAPLIGIVPYNEDDNICGGIRREDYVDYLQELVSKGWHIALHGYNHRYTTKKGGLFPLNDFSEYAGLPYEQQATMIEEGLKRLKELGLETDIFMAPAHSYDRNTLRALTDKGIRYVTDGFGSQPYEYKGLIFLPILKRSGDAISDREGISTLVLHTNTMTDEEIDNFGKKIRDHRDRFTDYDEIRSAAPVRRGRLSGIIEYIEALTKRTLVKIIVALRSK
ncbi:MAG: DUF2334 domain-containing protein [Lachnospiraceae bacterium]|nr:DUF2334 domain-containing protein [Lachnospiraceae bacterium]